MQPGEDMTFEVEGRWKEEVIYWEGSRGFVFDAGWGVQPLVLYVPSEAEWDSVTAEWMVGRRALIVSRLAERSGHVLREGGYKGGPAGRTVLR
ncbi:hypothetical protein [Agromyces laixinhei]|uniref:hypothetical protein n=1 Tax=Agromyces laixinhei TaxID=2585717 RepID=UPI0012EDDABE|nr:hypothetical protein [Agromyces laixinhei]